MKHKILTLALLGSLVSTAAVAQENLEHAFIKFIDSKHVTVTKSFSEERDITQPSRPLISKADVYTFTLKAKHKKLIDEVLAAFDKDRHNENVYLVLNHTGGRGIPTNGRQLLVGNDTKNAVYIGMNEMESWQLLCLLDPTDESRTHRYAYAIEWNDAPAQYIGGMIRGKLVVTYSRIPEDVTKYTGSVEYNNVTDTEEISRQVTGMIMDGSIEDITNTSQLVMAFDMLKREFLKGNAVDEVTGGTLAMSIYTLCSHMGKLMKGYPQMDDPDLRKHLIDELKTMKERCDITSDLGLSHLRYLELAQKALR
ncbi:MAG: hypothetical protein IJ605_02115 [Prevotella sp.]|nr:hypothetical protein [Prevotella sp.]